MLEGGNCRSRVVLGFVMEFRCVVWLVFGLGWRGGGVWGV